MESRVENSKRSLLERRKGYQIRLDEIKHLWKRRNGDYSRRRSRRDHAPTRRRRTPTIHTEDEKELEAELETLKAHGSFDVKLESREVRSTIEEDEPEMTVMKNLETEMEDKIQKKEDEGKGRERSITNVSVTVAEPEKCFEGDDDEGPRKQGSVPETDLHHRAAVLFLSDQPSATIRPNRCHRDAAVKPQSDLKPPLPLRAKTRKEIVGDLSVPPPEPPDRGVFMVESHDLAVLLTAAKEQHGDGKEKAAGAEGLIMRSSHTADLMGLGQTSSINSTPFINEERLFKEETQMGLVIRGPLFMSLIELETEHSFIQNLTSQNFNLTGERGKEENFSMIWPKILNNSGDLRFKAYVKHSINLIHGQISDSTQNAYILVLKALVNASIAHNHKPVMDWVPAKLYGNTSLINEQHRHRYMVHPDPVWGFPPTHSKQWDPGGNYYESSISWSLCFKQSDPGERFFVVRFIYLHLEDKVSFEGAAIDANPLYLAQRSSGAQGVR